MVHMLQNMYRTWCRSCTSEDFWVVVAEGQCANCHDLRDSAEPEVLGIPDLLHVSQALWRMPASKITVSFCRSSDGLSKDWGSRTCVLQSWHSWHPGAWLHATSQSASAPACVTYTTGGG